MEKKVGDIIEAFENYRFEDALRQIDQLSKKLSKDTKKKSALSEKDQRTIDIVKCGSLASMSRLHEANHLFSLSFDHKKIQAIPADQSFLFASIAELVYDENIVEKIEMLNKTGKSEGQVERFFLSHRMFSRVSKTFLKQFALGKRPEDGFAQVFLEYLAELDKISPIESNYKSEPVISKTEGINLKMVELFFMKFLAGNKVSEIKNEKLKASVIDFKIRMALNQGKIEEARRAFDEHFEEIKFPFSYLRSIRECQDQKEQNRQFYIESCGRIFQRNIEIEKYVPMYDYYDEFLTFIIDNDRESMKNIVLDSQKHVTIEQCYHFQQCAKSDSSFVSHYYCSLASELQNLRNGKDSQKAKKSDYFKICQKGLLLQMLRIHYEHSKINSGKLGEDKQFLSLLSLYFKLFSNKLTYLNEMENYIDLLSSLFSTEIQSEKDELPTVFSSNDDNLILFINVTKVEIMNSLKSLSDWSSVECFVYRLWGYYFRFRTQVEHNKCREKGEIYLSDEFIVMICDLIIYYIESQSLEEENLVKILKKAMAMAESTIQVSPYNAYLKLRALYFANKLNYFERVIQLYQELDIKSVQFETLGYYLLNVVNSFNLVQQNEDTIVKMVRSYHQNQRDTSEYCLKALKNGASWQVIEYFSYQKCLQRPFSKLFLFYSLYLRFHREKNSQFYLDYILKTIETYRQKGQKITFNSDFKTMKNIFCLGQPSVVLGNPLSTNELFGYLSSLRVFECQIKLRRCCELYRAIFEESDSEKISKEIFEQLHQIRKEHAQLTNIQKTNLSFLYSFKEFQTTQQYLGKNPQQSQTKNSETMTSRTIHAQLKIYLELSQVKIVSLSTGLQIFQMIEASKKIEDFKFEDQKQAIEGKRKQLEGLIHKFAERFSLDNQWRLQVKMLWTIREVFFTTMRIFSAVNEYVSQLKKINKAVKSYVSSFNTEFEEIITKLIVTIKLAEPISGKSDFLKDIKSLDSRFQALNEEKDSFLSKVSEMSLKDAKKYLQR